MMTTEKNMLLQLQQRAEYWAASGEQFCVTEKASSKHIGILTLVMSS
jgi:hypothetical protein